MVRKFDKFEDDIAASIEIGDRLPKEIPQWMVDLGVIEEATVINVNKLGSIGGKTDIYIGFDKGESLKISAKLSSADYYGNWYSHKRLIEEFGDDIFKKIVIDCTEWSNKWIMHENASFFIGVSICFGKRSGNTGIEFTDIFSVEDIIKIVAGTGGTNDIGSANCLLVEEKVPENITDLISKLRPINSQVIRELARNFKVIYRPINPMTEKSNRGKCIYSRFIPLNKHENILEVNSLEELRMLGSFKGVESDSLNHNRHIKDLKDDFNIIIPVKE